MAPGLFHECFSMNVGGGLIHALLAIAAVILLFNFFSGRRSVV
jgi:hypothetical protein